MPGERLSMRKIRELLRLRWEQHLPQRVIANSLRLGQASVSDYLSRARRAGLTWLLSEALDDASLEALLFPPLPIYRPTEARSRTGPRCIAICVGRTLRWRCCGKNTSTTTFVAPVTTIERKKMLIHPMAERLRGLGLTAMADAFLDMHNQSAADDLSREDWLGLLIDREVTARDNKRLGRRLNLVSIGVEY